jgi:hypothetical protein
VYGFKRSTYSVPDGTFAASWWQFGERIFFFRERRVS